MDLTHAIVFVAGMFVGVALTAGFFEWSNSITKPTSRAVDPNAPLR